MAKAAQDRLTQDLAFELAPKGVRVNSVLPGEVLASSQACTAIVGVVERAMHVITWASETSCSRFACYSIGSSHWLASWVRLLLRYSPARITRSPAATRTVCVRESMSACLSEVPRVPLNSGTANLVRAVCSCGENRSL